MGEFDGKGWTLGSRALKLQMNARDRVVSISVLGANDEAVGRQQTIEAWTGHSLVQG